MPSATPVRRGARPAAALTTTNGAAMAAAQQPANTIAGLLSSPSVKEQMALVLPKHITADRLARIALTEVRRNPKLAQCDPASFLGALMECASLGLEIGGGSLAQAWLIPYGREVQFQPSYRGLIELAMRSGRVETIEPFAVYEGDKFECVFGLHSDIKHEPDWSNPDRTDPKRLAFVYAVAHLRDIARPQFLVMSRAEIERIKKRSKSATSGPWVTDYEAMAFAKVLKRLCKRLPMSPELIKAVTADDALDNGQAQENPLSYLASAAPAAEALPSANGNGAAAALPQAQSEPVISEQQLTQLQTAITRRLSVVGEAALLADLLQQDGVDGLENLPVSSFDPLMRSLADKGRVENWNGGNSSTGEPLLSQEQINELVDQAQAAEAEAAELPAEQQASFV